jgi:lysozyme family protein
MNFDQAFAKLLHHEGGWSDHAMDPGGKTMYGITEAVARANGYTGDIRDLTTAQAKEIYKKAYWDAIQADKIHPTLRFDTFDAAVNSGVGQAARWLQRAVGAKEDGIIGPMTLDATQRNNPEASRSKMIGYRLLMMTQLKTWPHFGRGWARRVAENLIGDA